MPVDFYKKINDFEPWVKLEDIKTLSSEPIVYLVRVVDSSGIPYGIKRAKRNDDSGIINIGSGKGSSRFRFLQNAKNITKREEWNKNKHHQLMLWWIKCDFDSIFNLASPSERNIEVCWSFLPTKTKKEALKRESQLLLQYKFDFADLPIGNLKSW